MWELLLKIVYERWADQSHPRKRFVRAIANLYESLVECHESFDLFKSNPSKKNEMLWRTSIEKLRIDILGVYGVFEIFAPTLEYMLTSYEKHEAKHFSMYQIHRNRDQANLESLIDRIGTDLTGDEFVALKEELARFIRDNISKEEYFHALASPFK